MFTGRACIIPVWYHTAICMQAYQHLWEEADEIAIDVSVEDQSRGLFVKAGAAALAMLAVVGSARAQ